MACGLSLVVAHGLLSSLWCVGLAAPPACGILVVRLVVEPVCPALEGFPGGASGKEPACQRRLDVRDVGLIPGSGRSPRGGHGNPLQYSCLENPMDRGAW